MNDEAIEMLGEELVGEEKVSGEEKGACSD